MTTDATATAQRDALQAVLGGAFTLEAELRGGGMSTVYRARDNALQRSVVVKVLPPDLAAAVSVALLPPAPTRGSTVTCCPRYSVSLAAKARATTSLAPPGANAFTRRIGFEG